MVKLIKNKKGATFFTLDTLIAGLIIIVTLILVLSIYLSKPVIEDIHHDLNNYANFITTTTMKEVRDNYHFAYNDAFEEDLELYVYQKAYKLIQEDEKEKAIGLIRDLTTYTFPNHIGIEYAVGDEIIYFANEQRRGLAKSSITTRILTFYVEDNENVELTTTNITVWS